MVSHSSSYTRVYVCVYDLQGENPANIENLYMAPGCLKKKSVLTK